MEINGKTYPMWEQFVEREEEWIGGWIEDFGDSMDKIIFDGMTVKTVITGIELRANGEDSAFFEVFGEEFSCGFDVGVGGIIGGALESADWITFSGYAGHQWRIKKRYEDTKK